MPASVAFRVNDYSLIGKQSALAIEKGLAAVAKKQERKPQGVKDFQRKERDLPFVVFLEIKKTIAAEAPSGNAFEAVHLDHGVGARRLAVVAEIIVAWRNVEMQQLHLGTHARAA